MAGACAYAQRQRPEDLTLEDLDRVSTFIVDTYYQAKLGTYLSCVFINASFVQPNESAAKRKQPAQGGFALLPDAVQAGGRRGRALDALRESEDLGRAEQQETAPAAIGERLDGVDILSVSLQDFKDHLQ